MMRSYGESLLGEECPFYRPNPYSKFNHFKLSTEPRFRHQNSTLPLQSSIEDLKMNNPFRNNITISSITGSKIPYSSPSSYSSYKRQAKEVEEVRSLWCKDNGNGNNDKQNQREYLEYSTAPRRMEDSFLRSKKEVKQLESKRISIALQELMSREREDSKEFFASGVEQHRIAKRDGERQNIQRPAHSSRKSTSNFKKSLARYASNNEEVVSKTHFQADEQGEEVVLVNRQPFYSTKVKERKLNF